MNELQPSTQNELCIRSRSLAAFAGYFLQQRPQPTIKNGRIHWVIHTAMTVSQLKAAYQLNPVYQALELHVDLARDIKQLKGK